MAKIQYGVKPDIFKYAGLKPNHVRGVQTIPLLVHRGFEPKPLLVCRGVQTRPPFRFGVVWEGGGLKGV